MTSARLRNLKVLTTLAKKRFAGEKLGMKNCMDRRPEHLRLSASEVMLRANKVICTSWQWSLLLPSDQTLQIEVEDLEQADAYLRLVEGDMARVFSKIGQSSSSKHGISLLNTIRQTKSLDYQLLWRQASVTMSHQDFEKLSRSSRSWLRKAY